MRSSEYHHLGAIIPFTYMSMLNRKREMSACTMLEDDFAQRIRPHLTLLLQVARGIVGEADAEDAAQEALTKAWLHINQTTLPDAAAMRAWLVRITLNVCSDWQRGRFGTMRRQNQSLTDSILATPIWYTDAPADAMLIDLRHAIDRLAPEYRQVVILRYYVGLNAAEIGEALLLPPPTVRSRLRRARQLLQNDISDIPFVEGVSNA